ncbi:hypothetical protein MF628_004311 [Paenibacillus polymyxa]|uniref:hypothetical protein n=1 Tax=Paenibacillus polymyxa TaxID=1406 RepID=UPI002025A0C0|nr:hypothetical protein [Paenibacillus polymyxa]URJ48298.1 hypothetical protein MF628_004311 [Paenibacillus polymyxa]
MSVFWTDAFVALGGGYPDLSAYSFIDENPHPAYGITLACNQRGWISLVLA